MKIFLRTTNEPPSCDANATMRYTVPKYPERVRREYIYKRYPQTELIFVFACVPEKK